MKKIVAAALAACMLLPCVAGCGNHLNTAVPEDTDVTFTIAKENGNRTVFGIGAEADPHFFRYGVGTSGTNENGAWECKEEDWQIIKQRFSDMNMKRLRMMLLPNWYLGTEAETNAGVYHYDTPSMQSLYRYLDTAQELDINVNITVWGVDNYMREPSDFWVGIPKEEYRQSFVDSFADCIKYLLEEKGYDCIKEVTLFNEPNTIYYGARACDEYCDLCVMMHESFQAKGIRNKVLFNLSDDAREHTWLAKTLINLEGIIDVCNSHVYVYGDTYNAETGESERDMSNEDICYNLPSYNMNNFVQHAIEAGVPHMWGEFGTVNGNDSFAPSRGIDLVRISLNAFNMGSVGMSHWTSFSLPYNPVEAANGTWARYGFWGFADEGYECRPCYYAYSLLTRFAETGDKIFPLKSADGNIVGVAFKNGKEWSYFVVNNGDENKKVSFLNMDGAPETLKRYVYDEKNVPTDNKVIGSNGEISADGRVLSDTVKARSIAVYSNK